jgi:hypothetical protein
MSGRLTVLDPNTNALPDIDNMTDEQLSVWMLQCLINRTTFRKELSDNIQAIIRCYKILTSNLEFSKQYKDLMYYRIDEIEEDVLTGDDLDLDMIPKKYDKYGNADLAPGYLRRAELAMKNKQWILERRNKLYQAKSQQDITTDGQALNAVILPGKAPKQESEE